MTQFKEKAGSNKENASVGLLVYPNLMAADILIYKATHVPVGEDQKQHLELTRDIAKKFNNDFKCENYFPIVEPLIPKAISRVMSLRDGKKKMSKSEDSDYSRINLKDNEDLIIQKMRLQIFCQFMQVSMIWKFQKFYRNLVGKIFQLLRVN